jgi:hypothetical protein
MRSRLAWGLVVLTVLGTAGTALYIGDEYRVGSPASAQRVVPVSYLARATLDTERESFALRERLVVPAESLKLMREEAEKPEELVALLLADTGWTDPRLVGDALELSREGRTGVEVSFARLTRRATVVLPIPDDLGGDLGFALSVTEATVNVVAPRSWVLTTAPPSDSEPLPGDMEQRQVRQQDALDEEGVQVELAGPLFRNELGAMLLALSVTGSVKWVVLLVFGVFADELKKLIGGILGRLRRRRGSAPTPAPPPPAQS